MASLVLGAVGGYFFGPIGFMIGSAIGNLLMPPKGQEGPRITDLKLQTAQYGSMINMLFGTIRVNNNVIQQTDLVEHKHKSGGKGGPQVTTYTYTASWICQLCDCQHTGPILAIQRIWADSRLIWSSVGNDPNAKQIPFTLYRGTETQLPDPTFEAIVGVGKQPAYRGTAYVTFTDMDLGDFGNRIPNLTFEVVASINVELVRVNDWAVPTLTSSAGASGQVNLGGLTFDGANAIYESAYDCSGIPGVFTKTQYEFDGTIIGNVLTTSIVTPNPAGDIGIGVDPVQNSPAAALCSHGAAAEIHTYWAFDGAICSGEIVGPPGWSPAGVGIEAIVSGAGFYWNNYIYAFGFGPAYIARWDAPLGVPNGNISAYYFIDVDTSPFTSGFGTGSVTVDPTDGTVWLYGATSGATNPVWHFDGDLNKLSFFANETGVPFAPGIEGFVVYAGYAAFDNNSGHIDLWNTNGGALFTHVATYTGTTTFGAGAISFGGGYFITTGGVFQIPAGTTYAHAVSVLSVACGLSTGDIDVTQIGQPLAGYGISTRTGGRDMITPLQQADFFDAVESDTKIKFVKRGSQPVVIIPDADCGAFPTGGQPPALLTVQRVQEVDLPQAVNVTYLNKNADYENNTQLSQRAVTQSQLQVTNQLPIVMTDQDGQLIAYTTLFSAWLEREQISFKTPRKYAYLEPCDVVGVGNYLIRLTERVETTENVIEWKGVVTLPQVFVQAPKSAPGSGPGSGFVPPVIPKTQLSDLVLLDSPLVTDDDAPNGYYAAMAGASDPSWRGAGLLKSIDGGVVYNQIATSDTDDSIGSALTALGNWTGPNIFDETNHVDIFMNAGASTLSSSNELGVLNGSNAGALGRNGRWEFIQWKNAVLINPRTYRLSGLLRGRRGTEWTMNTHAAGDVFVVLPTTLNINGAIAELALARDYKAVTVGNPTASAAVVAFTNNGMALLCYSPVQLGGGRDSSGDITLNWIRRTRIGGAWVNFTDVPLGETNEAYIITFYTSATYATIVFTVPVLSATTYTLTAADQTSFFGGLQNPLYWDVAQIGSYAVGTATRGAT